MAIETKQSLVSMGLDWHTLVLCWLELKHLSFVQTQLVKEHRTKSMNAISGIFSIFPRNHLCCYSPQQP